MGSVRPSAGVVLSMKPGERKLLEVLSEKRWAILIGKKSFYTVGLSDLDIGDLVIPFSLELSVFEESELNEYTAKIKVILDTTVKFCCEREIRPSTTNIFQFTRACGEILAFPPIIDHDTHREEMWALSEKYCQNKEQFSLFQVVPSNNKGKLPWDSGYVPPLMEAPKLYVLPS